jgi:type IV secretory pathway VirB2 component (pilin)
MGDHVSETLHSNAPHHLPGFITAPGDTDTLMVVVGIVLIGSVMMVGNLYLRLHSLPERMAHKSQKLQFEIVAVLGLIALFTHNHLFWVIGLLLAMVDLPDFGTPLRSIAGSVRKIADGDATNDPVEFSDEPPPLPIAGETSSRPGEAGGHGHA